MELVPIPFGANVFPRASETYILLFFYKRGGNTFLLGGIYTNSYSITFKQNTILGIFFRNGPLAIAIRVTTEASTE